MFPKSFMFDVLETVPIEKIPELCLVSQDFKSVLFDDWFWKRRCKKDFLWENRDIQLDGDLWFEEYKNIYQMTIDIISSAVISESINSTKVKRCTYLGVSPHASFEKGKDSLYWRIGNSASKANIVVTPILLAALNRDSEWLQYLIGRGGDINHKRDSQEPSLIEYFIILVQDYPEHIDFLIAHGTKINVLDVFFSQRFSKNIQNRIFERYKTLHPKEEKVIRVINRSERPSVVINRNDSSINRSERPSVVINPKINAIWFNGSKENDFVKFRRELLRLIFEDFGSEEIEHCKNFMKDFNIEIFKRELPSITQSTFQEEFYKTVELMQTDPSSIRKQWFKDE